MVIGGYIEGVRKRYLNPISYLGIALTLSGIALFFLRKYALDKFDFSVLTAAGMDAAVTQKITLASLDFNSFVYILYIPILAIAGWLVFNKRKYHFPEYLVVGTYALAHFSIFTFPITMTLLVAMPESYLNISYPMILIMAFYATYVVNSINGGFAFGKSLLFLFCFAIGFLGIGILLNILFLVTGVLDIQDLIPNLAH